MPAGLLGRKIGMSQLFTEDGAVVPVTVVEAGPCVVVQRKTTERDGYEAVQLGFGAVKERRVNRPLKGHFARAGVSPRRVLREFRLEDAGDFNPQVGQEVRVDIFRAGERVDVTAVSKGKGFQGVIKRHGMRRGPMSHGSKYHRRVGSLGASTFPARVFPGRRMPGRMGGRRVTVRNLEVVRVDPERHLLLLKGSVPGPRGAVVAIRRARHG
ncbi:MAG: 50S ribosomal protein L3 [Clostridia bacterium]|nr:50S ribosomal protein L3 [Clostridia bacterium]